jgi:nucleoside-diphosphate-sugar epimerase
MNLNTNLVLITGPLGWPGARLVEALLHGLPGHPALAQPQPDLRIRCLAQPGQDFLPLAKSSDRIRVVVGDLRRAQDCVRFCDGAKGAVLFHCASVRHPRWSREFCQVNCAGTTALLEAAVKAGVRRVVAVSHAAACGGRVQPDLVLDEASPCQPRDAFGRSMLGLEQAVAARKGELETVILRVPQSYGLKPPAPDASLLQRLLEGQPVFAGTGAQLRSLAFLDNVCQGLLLAAATPRAAGQHYWIADRPPGPAREVAATFDRLLEKEFGRKPAPRRPLSPAVCTAAGALTTTLQTVGLAVPRLADLAALGLSLACTVAKAEKELGYRPAIGLEDGLRRSLRAWTEAAPAATILPSAAAPGTAPPP